MKTYTEPQQEVIAEHTLRLDVNHTRERNLRFLYIWLGIGIVLLATGLFSLIMM